MERGRLHVPQVALHARDPEGLAAPGAERLADRVRLDGIPDRGPRRMRLDVVDGAGVHRRPLARASGDRNLGVAGGGGDLATLSEPLHAVRRARGVDCGALHESEDPVAVRFGERQRLQREDERAFGSQVPVRARVEAPAASFGADDPQGVEPVALHRAAEVVDGPDEGLAAVPDAERGHRRVGRGEGRGARGAVRRRRPHQVEVVRDPVREHREAHPGHGVLVDTDPAPVVRDRRHLRPDEDAGVAVMHRLLRPARALQGFGGAPEQHPHDGARLHHLVVREAEEPAVDSPLVPVADEALPGAREPSGPRVPPERGVAPAVAVLDRLAHDAACREQTPKGLVGAKPAREAVGVGDDRDGRVGLAGGHGFLTSVREATGGRGARSGLRAALKSVPEAVFGTVVLGSTAGSFGMKIALICRGSTGDVAPTLALCRRLLGRDHRVRICAARRHLDAARAMGPEVRAIDPAFDPDEYRAVNDEMVWAGNRIESLRLMFERVVVPHLLDQHFWA